MPISSVAGSATAKFLLSATIGVSTIVTLGWFADASGGTPLPTGQDTPATTTTTAAPTTTTTAPKSATTTVTGRFVDENGQEVVGGELRFYEHELDPNHPNFGNPVLVGGQSITITRSQEAQIDVHQVPLGYRLVGVRTKRQGWTGNTSEVVEFQVRRTTGAVTPPPSEAQLAPGAPVSEPESTPATPQPQPEPQPEPQPQPQQRPQPEPEPQPEPQPDPEPDPEPEPEPDPEPEPEPDPELEAEREREQADAEPRTDCEYDPGSDLWFCGDHVCENDPETNQPVCAREQ